MGNSSKPKVKPSPVTLAVMLVAVLCFLGATSAFAVGTPPAAMGYPLMGAGIVFQLIGFGLAKADRKKAGL